MMGMDAPPPAPTPPVLALVRDLIFASKISATARAIGIACLIVRDPARLTDQPGDLLLVDLNEPGAIEAAAAWGQRHSRPVVGFVSHVDAARIAQARDAGIPRVMARSAFVEALPNLLRQINSPA
jgi:AmiR/NasT family two-component response regulator